MFYALDLTGTIAFAMSGTLAALNKRLDPFGIFIIAFVTAIGGGTLRDVLIGRTPVGWMLDLHYVYVIIFATIFALIIRNYISYLSKTLFLFDTIGLGIFTIIGTEIGIQQGLHPVISIALGVTTATFGGVIRDILCNDIPVIFRKEIYASACLVGAIAFMISHHLSLSSNVAYIFTTSVVIAIRLIAVKYNISLPMIPPPIKKDKNS
ncbi:trimeric intracellular cation channel family protein [Flavobacteriaceae bacterium F08102]|nr:trimeric intracellular cation channel family protein [Flavobacteriaceae bacterium F08102]